MRVPGPTRRPIITLDTRRSASVALARLAESVIWLAVSAALGVSDRPQALDSTMRTANGTLGWERQAIGPPSCSGGAPRWDTALTLSTTGLGAGPRTPPRSGIAPLA